MNPNFIAATFRGNGKDDFISGKLDQPAVILVSETTIDGPELDRIAFLETGGIRNIDTSLLIVVRC